MIAHRCIAPTDDAAQQLCGARATTTRIVDDLVCHLCSAHAAELDREQSEDSMTMTITRQRTLYGIRNVAFYADPREDTRYYLTRRARDTALVGLRDLAVSRGLAVSAATAGIYPVKRIVRDVSVAESLIETAAENERALAAHVEVAS